MTEPTRDALHAETLETLARETGRLNESIKYFGGGSITEGAQDAIRHYAYAVRCVRFVDAIRNGTAPMYDGEHHCWLVGGEFWAEGGEYANAFDAWSAYAAATREGSDNA